MTSINYNFNFSLDQIRDALHDYAVKHRMFDEYTEEVPASTKIRVAVTLTATPVITDDNEDGWFLNTRLFGEIEYDEVD